MSSQHKNKGGGVFLLCLTVFFVTAVPRARFTLGPVPVYFMDILAFMAILAAAGSGSGKGRLPSVVRTSVVCFSVAVLLAQINNAVNYQWVLEPAYQFARYILAVVFFFMFCRVVVTYRQVVLVLRSLVLGLLVTSALSIATSVPGMRGIAKPLFSNRFLEPAVGRGYKLEVAGESATRSMSLVGTSTITGGFIITLWPISLLLLAIPGSGVFWRRVAQAASILAPFGAIATYSRTALLGLAGILLVQGMFAKGRSRRGGFFAVGTVAAVVYFLGAGNSNYFYFERIERQSAVLEGDFSKEGDLARFLSYTAPFIHIMNHPEFAIFGEGTTGSRIGKRVDASDTGEGMQATHSSFARAYLTFGLPGLVSHVILIVFVIRFAWKNSRAMRQATPTEKAFAQGLLAIVVGMFPFWLFGHAIISSVRGFFLFLIVVALLCVFRCVIFNNVPINKPIRGVV